MAGRSDAFMIDKSLKGIQKSIDALRADMNNRLLPVLRQLLKAEEEPEQVSEPEEDKEE